MKTVFHSEGRCKRQLGFTFIILFTFSISIAQTNFQSLNYLYSISGKQCVSGMHNREPNASPAEQTTAVYNVTGKYPGFWSGDFLFQSDNINNRGTMINEAKREWGLGSIVHLMWHACSPAISEPCGWDASGVLSKMTDAQWTELITDGTAINLKWKSMMDEVAVYLKDLQNSGVEVFFRPLHEMNQGVFWWGGRSGPNGTVRLYQITHDYLQNTKGISNIIWEWDLQDFSSLPDDLNNYNPGNSYWDVLAMDMYSSDGTGYTTAKYNAILNAANGKPIAIGECQVLPTISELTTQPKWAYFMSWAELTFSNNSNAQIQTLYLSPNVITLDHMPGWINSTGVKERTENELRYHPNPIGNTLFFTTELDVNKLEIINTLGENVMTFISPSKSIDISMLNSGLYLILLFDKDGIVLKSFKIIKDKV